MVTRTTGFLGQLGQRLTETLEESDSSELQSAARVAGTDRAADCACGDIGTILGRICTVTYGTEHSDLGVSAEIYDGSGYVQAVWLGRRSIPGITTGRCVQVTGRITDSEGQRTMFNPRYELRNFIAVPRAERLNRER